MDDLQAKEIMEKTLVAKALTMGIPRILVESARLDGILVELIEDQMTNGSSKTTKHPH